MVIVQAHQLPLPVDVVIKESLSIYGIYNLFKSLNVLIWWVDVIMLSSWLIIRLVIV